MPFRFFLQHSTYSDTAQERASFWHSESKSLIPLEGVALQNTIRPLREDAQRLGLVGRQVASESLLASKKHRLQALGQGKHLNNEVCI